MKKVINISLWIVIFLLVAFICVLSIKKFFDKKHIVRLDNILAVNWTSDFVSFNKLEATTVDKIEIKDVIFQEKPQEREPVIEKTETNLVEDKKEHVEIKDDIKEDIEIDEDPAILFNGLTEADLLINLEKHLKNELSGTASKFVEYYKTTGLDPYLAASIVLHETGCTWKCSSLVRECYNYGGMKGGQNKYKETNYTCYSSKEEGINAYLNMLYNNYYAKGLTTPELINPKYAASLEWATAINRYMDKFKIAE